MKFLTTRASAVWLALRALNAQFWLALDQMGNVLFPGACACIAALWTGKTQNVAYADETLSAHCWRSFRRARVWGLWFMRPIDRFFDLFQGPDDEVNAAAGSVITGHCERAYWKERLRRNLPPEYREN